MNGEINSTQTCPFKKLCTRLERIAIYEITFCPCHNFVSLSNDLCTSIALLRKIIFLQVKLLAVPLLHPIKPSLNLRPLFTDIEMQFLSRLIHFIGLCPFAYSLTVKRVVLVEKESSQSM